MAVQGVIGIAYDPDVTMGWAVVVGQTINVRTVSPTRRGALINWIVIEVKIAVHDNWPDEQIEEVFNRHRGAAEARQVEIKVR